MKLIVGLGNPGSKYARTRHNAGFWWLERLVQKINAEWHDETRFHGRIAKLSGDRWLLLPQTYMNESGRAVAALAAFHKIAPGEILVAHDELDLPPGGIKLKFGGGVAGHNGLKDIAAHLGSNDFWRLRLGIGHPRDQTASEQEVVDYVLHPPRVEEQTLIDGAIIRSIEVWPLIAGDDMETAMLKLHTKEKKSE